MTVIALIGGQWGEEGKGKLTELLAEQCKVVVRYSGGGGMRQPVRFGNSTFNLQYMPRSIFNNKTISVLGAGMVFDPKRLVEEMQALRTAGHDLRRFYVSEQAHVVMPYHFLQEETERKAYGTPLVDAANSGIGPAYADKISRIGMRASDLLQEELFLSRLSRTLSVKNEILTKVFGQKPFNLQQIYLEYMGYGRDLRDHIFDTRLILQRAFENGHRILLESDQGSMLDVDFGIYPFISNAAPTVGAASSSSGIPPTAITGAVGVFGAYISRTQGGPFPTEMTPQEARTLLSFRNSVKPNTGALDVAQSTSSVYRRFGWFDTVAARFVCQLNGLTSIALTNLDGLDNFDEIKISTEYQVHDTALSRFPSDLATLRTVRPVYTALPGWKAPTTNIKNFEDLPQNCQSFILKIQQLVGVRVDIISTGPERDQTIVLRDPFAMAKTARSIANATSDLSE